MASSSRTLPAADRAVVELTKMTEYLLNAGHPDNGGKARFFESCGFSASEPGRLVAALKDGAAGGEVVLHVSSIHGTKYVVDGRLGSSGSQGAFVRTVWIVDKGQEFPRLVTAYPREE
jgi:hypothetical protein